MRLTCNTFVIVMGELDTTVYRVLFTPINYCKVSKYKNGLYFDYFYCKTTSVNYVRITSQYLQTFMCL